MLDKFMARRESRLQMWYFNFTCNVVFLLFQKKTLQFSFMFKFFCLKDLWQIWPNLNKHKFWFMGTWMFKMYPLRNFLFQEF